jgi:ElaB/YqjD/DUF883 family membrane-anchored ribosome-binding protein
MKKWQTPTTVKNMSKHKRRGAGDLDMIAGYAQDLITATADVTGEQVENARKHLNEALAQGKETYEEVREQALSSVRIVDDFISDNPYAAVGIGVGVGVLIGFLLRGKRDTSVNT